MKIKYDHLCKCGHPAASHTTGVFGNPKANTKGVTLETIWKNPYGGGCGRCESNNSKCKKFQLPNLDLIEYLAEKRGLI